MLREAAFSTKHGTVAKMNTESACGKKGPARRGNQQAGLLGGAARWEPRDDYGPPRKARMTEQHAIHVIHRTEPALRRQGQQRQYGGKSVTVTDLSVSDGRDGMEYVLAVYPRMPPCDVPACLTPHLMSRRWH